MPQILTMTRKEGETDAAFAARIATKSSEFFGGSKPSEEEPEPETTDVSADQEAPSEEEPAPTP